MGKIIGFTEDQQAFILKQSLAFWEDATFKMGPYFNFVNEMERLTRVLLPKQLESQMAKFPDRSALVPPDIRNNLASVKAIIRRALFRKKPYFPLEMVGEWNAADPRIEKATQQLQAIMDMEADGKGFPHEASKAVFQALYAGLTVVVTRWHREYGKRVVRDPETHKPMAHVPYPDTDPDYKIPLMKDTILAEYPETKSLDIRRVRINSTADDFDNISLIGYHGQSGFADLVALNRNTGTHYEFDEKSLAGSSFDSSNYYMHVPREGTASPGGAMEAEYVGHGDKPVEVYSIRGLYRLPNADGTVDIRDLIVEIGNRKLLLALKDNDLPLRGPELFDFPRIEDQHGRMYAMGLVEAGRDLFVEMFIKRNQSIDAANRSVHNTYLADSNAMTDMPDVVESANDQIYALDLASAGLMDVRHAMAVLERPALGQDTFDHSQVLSRELQQTHFVNDYVQGKDPQRSETATGVVALTSGPAALTEDLIEILNDTYFAPCSRKKLILWTFFKGHDLKEVTLSDGTRAAVTLEDLELPLKVSVRSAISPNDAARQRRLVEMMPLLMNDPFYDQFEFRRMLNDVMDLPNSHRLLKYPEVVRRLPQLESFALAYGIDWDVHPMDNQRLHSDEHGQYIEYLQSQPPESLVAQGINLDKLIAHKEQHDEEIANQDTALGNTKELGGAVGNLTQPDGARQKLKAGASTGVYLPKGNRR